MSLHPGFISSAHRGILGIALAALAVVLVSSSAWAGPLATTNLAYNDGLGPDGGVWRGSINYSASGPSPSNDVVDAVVDFAVFPPGDRFAQFLSDNGYSGSDPSNGVDEAVYVYQISSVTSAVPGIGALTVGLDPTDLISSISSVATGGGDVAPTATANQTTSAFYDFDNAVGAGQFSSLLVMVSPAEPQLDTMHLSSGLASLAVSPLVPSPTDSLGDFREVPEPTAALLGMVMLGGLASRRRRG